MKRIRQYYHFYALMILIQKKEFEEVSSEIDVYYDELFYGKEIVNDTTIK